MIVDYKEYQIEIKDDNTFSLNSTDNINSYDNIYLSNIDKNEMYISNQYSIRVQHNNKEVSSAILIGFWGKRYIDKSSFILKDNTLFICSGNYVFALNATDLSVKWKRKIDESACFNIYYFKENILVHGELAISRIDLKGNKKWSFTARDAFVLPEGDNRQVLSIKNNQIEIIDWESNTYTLNENGELINQHIVSLENKTIDLNNKLTSQRDLITKAQDNFWSNLIKRFK